MKNSINRKRLLGTIIILILAASSVASFGTSESRDDEANGVVRGTVCDADTNETMTDVWVRLYSYDTGSYDMLTDENGSYRFEDLPRVEYDIWTWTEGYYDHDGVISLEHEEIVEYDIYLEPYECSVFGYVYDYNTWQPIDDDAYVILEGYDLDDRWYSTNTYPDSEGYYELYSPPGQYSFKAGGSLYHEYSDRITLADGDELQKDIYLVPFCYICGFIYDVETDEPIEEVEVRLNRQYSGEAYVHLNTIHTNETGEYYFAVESGVYVVEVHKPGYKSDRHEYVVMEEGVSMAYDFYLEVDYGLLSGYVCDEDSGTEIEGASVYTYNYDNWRSFEVFTDENGYYEVYPGAGDVYVEVYMEGYKRYYNSVAMQEDEPRELNVYLEPYESVIFGTVTDAETLEPVYAYVSLEGEDIYRTTDTDPNGSYRFYVDGGEFSISVSAEGYNTYKDIIAVESGEELQIDVSLAQYNTRVFGYVTDGDGEPISDVYVRIESERYYYDTLYTEDDGYYEFVIPPSSEQGEYTLDFSADGYRDRQDTFWLEEGEELQIDVTMQDAWSPGSIWRWIWEAIFG